MRSLVSILVTLASIACTGPGSPDTDGADDAATGTGTSESDTESSNTESTEGETGETSETGETGETGEMIECELLDEAACQAAPGCYSVIGVPVSTDLDCREPPRFAICSSNEFAATPRLITSTPRAAAGGSVPIAFTARMAGTAIQKSVQITKNSTCCRSAAE